jgi:hypothetical protein
MFVENEEGKSVIAWRSLTPSDCLDLRSYQEKFEGTIVVLLCHGGYFAGGVFVSHKCVAHKTFRRYLTRKKQGNRQGNCDKHGGCMKSAGSQLRRYNEVKHRDEVQELLSTWHDYVSSASLIFMHAPGINRTMFFPTSQQELKNFDERIKSVPMTTGRPSYAEVNRVWQALSTLQINRVAPENLELALEKISLSLEKEKEREKEAEFSAIVARPIVMPKPRHRAPPPFQGRAQRQTPSEGDEGEGVWSDAG